jgi:hypothetical protein
MDILKEKYTEYSSSLINNKRIGAWTRLITTFVAATMISSVFIISQTHDELLAKKSTGNKSGVDGGNETTSLSGNNTSDTTSSNSTSSSSSWGNTSASDLNTVAPVDETHCDKKGYPSCYNLGYSDGQNAPGTSCPSGHSEAYCNGYEVASLSGNSSSSSFSSWGNTSASDLNTVAPVDETHCDKKGYPSCYNLGYSDGQNAPGTSCPSGHSEAYCNGYEAASLSGNSSSSSPSYNFHPGYPSLVTQNPKTKINQEAASNADINVSNSSGTRITNEQIIKQSVRINNEVNNLIRNNEVNKIIKENTVSAPQQPLTDLLTVKLANSSMSSGALFPLADVEPYSVIGGHITANLPISSQQNIVVAQISDGEIQHAVILDLKQITGSNLDQNSLYETSLGSDISGTNPFTGHSDEVSSITNLFLWNNNQQSIIFDNANGVTMNLIYR